MQYQQKQFGFTLIELIITVVIVAILAGSAFPMLKMTVQRKKESTLQANLRIIRSAIDRYKDASDNGNIEKKKGASGYPPNLTILVEGVVDKKDPEGRVIKFLRRIPPDPMRPITDTSDFEPPWGLRSYESDADNPEEGEDVFDVYSLSDRLGTNKIPYSQW